MEFTKFLAIKEDKITTTSQQLAIAFNKEHGNVLKAIDKIIIMGSNGVTFDLVDYRDEKGELRRSFLLDRNAFMLCVMYFSGEKAHKIKLGFIEAFNKMEQELLSKAQPKKSEKVSRAEMLLYQAQLLYNHEKALEEQAEKLAEHDSRILKVEAKITTKNEDYYTVAGYMALNKIKAQNKGDFISYGRKASRESKSLGLAIFREYDPKHGDVGSYHKKALDNVFGNKSLQLI